MNPELQQYLIKLVKSDLGNAQENLARAEHAFRGDDLSETYYGETKGAIIEGYRKWVMRATAALNDLEDIREDKDSQGNDD